MCDKNISILSNSECITVLIIPLTIFVPLMFLLSKNLTEKIATIKNNSKPVIQESKENINSFCYVSGLYLHLLSLFSIFQLLKIICREILPTYVFDSLYLITIGFYVKLEKFKTKSMITLLVSGFGIIPFMVFTFIPLIPFKKPWDQNTLVSMSILFYLLIWFYFPVKYHPFENLYIMLREDRK